LAGLLNNKWVRRLAMWVLLPMVLIYGFIQLNYPTCTFRYKLTAEVMTPDGLKTGSSVIEVSFTSFDVFGLVNRQGSGTVTGEAVYVDLGGGKNLFVLLGADSWDRLASSTPTNEVDFDGLKDGISNVLADDLGKGSLSALWLPIQVYKLSRIPGHEWDMQGRANALLGQAPVEVPLINVPMIGTFADLSKPETFNTLPPREIDKFLGDGYLLRSVKMQIVEDETSDLIRIALPWLLPFEERSIIRCPVQKIADLKGACRVKTGNFRLSNSKYD
jgi:hypothetical protein